MPERTLAGVPAAPGLAAGEARIRDRPPSSARATVPPDRRAAEVERAERALNAAAAELAALGERLRPTRPSEAEIVETGALMAADPTLRDAVARAIVERGSAASDAILEAADLQAALLAELDDVTLAARAADVRSLGRRAARLAAGGASMVAGGTDAVLVATDLGPADVVELGPEVRAVALAAGGVTAHAAIVARSLGLPMVVGLGDPLLALPDRGPLVVDGTAGTVVAAPSPERLAAARAADAERRRPRARAAARDLPAVTRDGRRVRVLANAAGPAEVAAALEAGAEGVGLLRTELAFLDAGDWPSREQHRRALEPVLAGLAGRIATVRLLDFGGDKTPPFLGGPGQRERGVQLLLKAPEALAAQLRAVLDAGRPTGLRVLVPMVIGPDDVRAVRELLLEAVAAMPGAGMPQLGAMIEVPAAAAMATHLAPMVDFFSIGTNDLTNFQLGLDRSAPGEAPAHHPAVLRLIAETTRAAREAGILVDVCGEAASDPVAMPLLLGLGVDELSVGAARVGTVRDWVRALSQAEARAVAERALEAASAAEVEELVRPLSAQFSQ